MVASLIWMSSSSISLLLHKVQTKCDSSEEKQVILALRARVRHHTGHHFIDPGEEILKRHLLKWPGINSQSSAMQGMASIMWHVDAVLPPQSDSRLSQAGLAKPHVAATFVFHVINKAGTCDTSINYIVSQTFSALHTGGTGLKFKSWNCERWKITHKMHLNTNFSCFLKKKSESRDLSVAWKIPLMFLLVKSKWRWPHPKKLHFQAKRWQNYHVKPADRNFCTFSVFSV